MRIGVLASVAHRTPPRDYGPWEQVASTLTEGFVAAGHDVTLYATSDSMTTARLRGTAPRGYEEDPEVDARVWGALHIARAFEDTDDLDVLANHFDFVPLTYSRLVRTPVVTTIHGFSSPRITAVYKRYDGNPACLELFGPQNAVCLKNGSPLTLIEGSAHENLHATHVHVAV